MKLDHINLKILAALQENARITNQDLADKVSLSPSACLTRMRWLEEAGYINSYCAMVDLDKVGSSLTAFFQISLENHYKNDFNKFDEAVRMTDEVVASFMVGARFDYLLQVVVRDMRHLSELSDRLISAEIGISKLITIPMLSEAKPFRGLPVAMIARQD